ncbi:MAG: penicillin-binding transpeptidase domain-containing protein [Lachnospiraceae bacterium]|nr:penicillin-binding transpeptidase domain-containing protein [Lachnospiraceae bacterium]
MSRKRRRAKVRGAFVIFTAIIFVAVLVRASGIFTKEKDVWVNPDELLITYMNYIQARNYEAMYNMIDLQKSGNISQDDFANRNSKIYEGIEMQNMRIENVSTEEIENNQITVKYQTVFDTIAGEIQFENEAEFVKGDNGYLIVWNDNLIFPNLAAGDKVRVQIHEAERGNILDRNGKVLAGKGIASSVGVVPGKLEDREAALQQIAGLLEMDVDSVKKKLNAGWVKEDSFVPLKTLPKVKETDLMEFSPSEEVLKEKERQEQLLQISGVMISDVEIREYPFKEAAAHLVGYVQNVTAEDLEKHEGEGYSAGSVIGRSGMEGLYEKELKGQDGCEIYIEDSEGNKKEVLKNKIKKNGENIKLTVDAYVQSLLYEQFKQDKSCTVAMNQYTGEVLALVSTPSFDNNDFIMGMSDEKWTALNEDKSKPLYNRFRQVWAPGSTFKPIIGAIGLKTGAINPNEDYGNEGLSWQKDSSWGDYYVTTLHAYEPIVLENAIIYSDNIYFAKAALKIGEKDLMLSLDGLGFNQEVPFEIALKESQYSNTDTIESEVQLADSGYGQGQILVSPLHLACVYTSFVNHGDMIKPYLRYSEGSEKEIWIEDAFPDEAAVCILDGLKKVVNNPHGTGYSAHREDIVLAGKTGTAEIKASKDDNSGTELGWFAVCTTDSEMQNPILIVSMAEDVKGIGGSGYVVKKVSNVLDEYLNR